MVQEELGSWEWSVNSLWEPPWEMCDLGDARGSLERARVAGEAVSVKHEAEQELLASIAGHSLCCDIFWGQVRESFLRRGGPGDVVRRRGRRGRGREEGQKGCQ